MNRLLIIFYRNPELGKVKTRLAETVGDENALNIHLKLAEHTRTITSNLDVDTAIYYSEYIDTNDAWSNSLYEKKLQRGSDIGQRMKNAMADGFNIGYKYVAVIGTDCLQLTTKILEAAYQALQKHDSVLGPAEDGSYYLLGLTKHVPSLFINKKWNTYSVYKDTIHDLQRLNFTFFQLPQLSNVDKEADLSSEWREQFKK